MNKNLFAIPVILATLLALTACSGTPQTEDQAPVTQEGNSYPTDTPPSDGGSWTQLLGNGATVDCVWTARNNGSGGLTCPDVTYNANPDLTQELDLSSSEDSFGVNRTPSDGGSWTQHFPDGGSIECVWSARNNGSGGNDCIDASYMPPAE